MATTKLINILMPQDYLASIDNSAQGASDLK